MLERGFRTCHCRSPGLKLRRFILSPSSAVISTPEDILDLVEESVIVRDPAGLITGWNAASAALYGWSKSEAEGRSLHGLLASSHPLSIGGLEARFAETGVWAGELIRTTRTGEEVLIDARWRLRRGDDGAPLDVVETGRSLSALNQKALEAQRTEHRYRNLFQAMAASFWDLDFGEVRRMLEGLHIAGVTDFPAYLAAHPDFLRQAIDSVIILDINDKTLAMFGADHRDQMVGQSIGPYWPKDMEYVFAQSLNAAVQAHAHFMTEMALNTLDGRRIDVLFTVVWPTENKGKGSIMTGVIDITDRKMAERALRESEHRYRDMFQSMAVSLWELDFRGMAAHLGALKAAGVEDLVDHAEHTPGFVSEALALTRVAGVNDKTLQLFGGAAIEDFLGPVARFWPAASHRTFLEALNTNYRGLGAYEAETRLLTLQGAELDVIFNAATPADSVETGRVLVGIVDVSEAVAARRSLGQMQAELAHAGRVSMLGELAASIAHEVNQPLSAIMANSQASLRWLDRPEPDIGEAVANTARIVADAGRAGDIVARIRGMATRAEPVQQRLSLSSLVEEAGLFLAHEIQGQSAGLDIDLPTEDLEVLGDRTQLQQVVVNLIVNGLQAMSEAGSDTRRITVTAGRANRRTLALSVRDTGPGIPQNNLASLFESFFTTKATGLGMGLSICRSIVEAHGGEVYAKNLQDGGAEVGFTIPAAPPAVP